MYPSLPLYSSVIIQDYECHTVVKSRPKSFAYFAEEGPLSTVATFSHPGRIACLLSLFLFAFFGLILGCSSRTQPLACEPPLMGPQSAFGVQLLGVPRRCLFGGPCFCRPPSRRCGLLFRVGRTLLWLGVVWPHHVYRRLRSNLLPD